MNFKVKKNLILILIFGIAMGFLEAIVVIYLREIYYPEGFKFPLEIFSKKILVAELFRESCTIIMLLSIAFIAGKNRLQILSYFLFNFAIWDIFYYVALKLFLNWPTSLLTWDVLFLIPVAWLAPVLAPLICSFSMIIISLIFLFLQNKKPDFRLRIIEWLFILIGGLLILVTFICNYTSIIMSNDLIGQYFSLIESDVFKNIISNYLPTNYNWTMFILGILSIYLSIFLILKRNFLHSLKTER